MVEEWRTVIHDGEIYDSYEVSNMGRVRNNKGLIMKAKLSRGYLQIGLRNNGKQKFCYVHRLVAFTFLPLVDGKTEVNHIDEDKTNNCVENLEWTTHLENMQHGTRTQRQKEKVKEKQGKKVLCVETGQVFNGINEACRWCGKKGVSACCRGKIRTCGGFHWEYVD